MNAALVAAKTNSPPSLDSGAARVRQLPQQSGGMDFFAFMADAQSLAQQQLSQRVDDAGPMNWQAPAEPLSGQPEAERQEPEAQPSGVASASAEGQAKPPEQAAAGPEAAADEPEAAAVPAENRAPDRPQEATAAGEKERTETAHTAQAVVSDKAEQQRSDRTRADDSARSLKKTGQEAVARRELAGEARERLAQSTQEMKRETSRSTKRTGTELGQEADRMAAAVQQTQMLAGAGQQAANSNASRVDRIQPVQATAKSTPIVAAAAKPVISPVKAQTRPVTERSAVGDPAAAPINASAVAATPAYQAGSAPARKSAAVAAAAPAVELARNTKSATQPVAVFAVPKTPARQLYRETGDRTAQREGESSQERAKPGPRLTVIDRRTPAPAADIPPAAAAVKADTVKPAAWTPSFVATTIQATETRAAAKPGGTGLKVEAAAKATGGDAATPAADAARSTATVTAKAVTAPAPVNRAEMAQQLQDLVKEARFTLTDNRTEVSMQLKPEALGRVRLQMAIEGDTVNGRLITETVAAKSALEEHLPEVLRQFEAQGLTVGSFSVEVRQQPQPAEQQNPDGGKRGGGRQDADAATDPGANDQGPQWYRHSDSRVEYIV